MEVKLKSQSASSNEIYKKFEAVKSTDTLLWLASDYVYNRQKFHPGKFVYSLTSTLKIMKVTTPSKFKQFLIELEDYVSQNPPVVQRNYELSEDAEDLVREDFPVIIKNYKGGHYKGGLRGLLAGIKRSIAYRKEEKRREVRAEKEREAKKKQKFQDLVDAVSNASLNVIQGPIAKGFSVDEKKRALVQAGRTLVKNNK